MQNREETSAHKPDITPHTQGLELPEFLLGLTFDTPATHTQTREVLQGWVVCIQVRGTGAGSALEDIH